MRKTAFLILAGFSIIPELARADRIEFANGKIMEGIVVREDESQVIIDDGTAQITVRRAMLRQIIKGSEADRRLIAIKGKLSGRGATDEALNEALIQLGKASEEGASAETLAAVMLVHAERITEAIPSVTGEGRRGLRAALAATKGARPAHRGDFLLDRLRWYLLLDEVELAREALDELKRYESDDLERNQGEVLGWLNDKTEAALEGEQFSKALDLLLLMRGLEGGSVGNKRVELILQFARARREAGEFREALGIYADQLMELSPWIARERIATTLDEAETLGRGRGEFGEAIDLREKFGMTYAPESSKPKLITLWRDLGTQSLRRGEIGQAREIFGRIEILEPGAAKRDLLYCDYEERKAGLGEGGRIAHYRLGEWCMEGMLLDEAQAHFLLAAESDELRSAAWEHIRRIENAKAEAELNRIMDLYESGKYFDVLHGIGELRVQHLPEGLAAQADSLERLTRDAVRISSAERPQQAEVLRQQAERAFFMGDAPKALDLLNALAERYPDTPAAARGKQLYRFIRPRVELDRIEKRQPSKSTQANPGPADGSPPEIEAEIRRLRPAASSEEKKDS